MSAEGFLARLRFEKRQLLAELHSAWAFSILNRL